MHIPSPSPASTFLPPEQSAGGALGNPSRSGDPRHPRREAEKDAGEALALTKTILLVDDEFGIVETLKELLESEGFRVLCASNGKDALDRMTTEVPDLAVVDVMMPVMNGIEVLRAMRASQTQKDVPVLLMSAVPRSIATQSAESLPASGWSFIRKPFEFNDLLDVIKRMIGTPERQVH